MEAKTSVVLTITSYDRAVVVVKSLVELAFDQEALWVLFLLPPNFFFEKTRRSKRWLFSGDPEKEME